VSKKKNLAGTLRTVSLPVRFALLLIGSDHSIHLQLLPTPIQEQHTNHGDHVIKAIMIQWAENVHVERLND
jgi:hypothetical protein